MMQPSTVDSPPGNGPVPASARKPKVMPHVYAHDAVVNALAIQNGDPRVAKLVHAHRVGMLAMETMGSRYHDETRSYSKFCEVSFWL